MSRFSTRPGVLAETSEGMAQPNGWQKSGERQRAPHPYNTSVSYGFCFYMQKYVVEMVS